MAVATSTVKDQIVIPVDIRRKFTIKRGSLVNIYDEGNRIIVEPLPEDPVQKGRGMLKTRGRILKALLEDRNREKYVMDSYAMIAFFEDESGAGKVAEILNALINQKARGFMPVINWGEIFYCTLRVQVLCFTQGVPLNEKGLLSEIMDRDD